MGQLVEVRPLFPEGTMTTRTLSRQLDAEPDIGDVQVLDALLSSPR